MKTQRRILQIFIFVGGLVPVLTGLSGMFTGIVFLQGDQALIDLDSHFRYLSALLFALGIAFWSCIPNIEFKEPRARILTFMVFIGGLTRFIAAFAISWPSLPMILAIGMELVVTPLLYIWLRALAFRHNSL